MDLVLDLLQAIGIGAAIGIRPSLPVLLIAVLAAANLGVDFDGTSFSFLESWPLVIAAVVVLSALELWLDRRAAPRSRAWEAVPFAVAVALGALQGAASVADRGNPIVLGVLGGAAAAALGYAAMRSLFARVRRRLDAAAARTLPLYAAVAALVVAGAAVLFPPLAIIVVAALAMLLTRGRRRDAEKYAGLRILR